MNPESGSVRRRSALFAALSAAFLLVSSVAHSQTCPPPGGNGGNGGTGGSGATLKTITLDGNPSDWSNVLTNPIQTTIDGETINGACNTAAVFDRDCPGKTNNISGRDLARFSWTFDTNNVYLYLIRYGSTNNQQSFLFYGDTNSNQRMNTNEKVLKVTFSGSNGTLDSTIYNYVVSTSTPAGNCRDASGDYMAAPASGATPPYAYPGYADGFTPCGTLTGGTTVDNSQNWVWSDGTGFEARIPWSSLGVPFGTAVYFHVSSINGSGSNVPSGIDDNLGGADGGIGVFAFRSLFFSPNRTSNVAAGTTFIDYAHTLQNTGSLPDFFEFVSTSNLGWRVELDHSNVSSPGTLMATDTNGDGTWDSVTPAYDGNSNGRPQTPVMNPNIASPPSYNVTVRLYPPPGANEVQDVTITSAVSMGSTTCLYASVVDTTAIGDLTLTPTPQTKSVIPSSTLNYGLKLKNFSLADVFDLFVTSACGWATRIYTDPNGDGNPADGVLAAVDLNGDGDYLDAGDSITAGYDTNSNGQVDFGNVTNGSTRDFVVQVTSSATVGATCTTTVDATGDVNGKHAQAVLNSTVRNRLTFTPSYTQALGTNKFSGPNTSVFFAHTLINSWSASDNVTLTGSTNHAYTVRYWTDPDGDGDPSDGIQITAPIALAAYGGTIRLIVEVVIPAGVATGTIDIATITATSGLAPAVTAQVVDETRISRIVTFEDPLRSISRSIFARCDTVYVKANQCTANTTTTYSVEYLNPSSVSVRNQVVPTDGNGDAFDQYTFTATDPVGNWTVRLMQGATVVDSITVRLDPFSTPSTVSPVTLNRASFPLTGSNLTITASYNNTSIGATYFGTTYRYLVRNPGGSQYLLTSGTFTAYSGTQQTRTTSPHDVAAGATDTESTTVSSVTFPAAGIYSVTVDWIGSCSNSIATTTITFPVGTTLGSFNDAAHTIPDEYFKAGETVYLGGSTYLPSTGYKVAYYRPDGTLVTTQSVTSTAGGTLSTSIGVAALTTDGLWTAMVYPATSTPPGSLSLTDPEALSSDTFTIDTTAPSLSITKPTAVTYQPSSDENGGTAGFQLTPQGTMELSATVSITSLVANSGGPAPTLGSVSYPTGTSWAVPQATWPVGNYTLTVQAVDLAGNTTSQNVTFSIAPTPPVVNSPLNQGATSVSGTSDQPVGSTITVYVGGSSVGTTTVQAGGTWTLTGLTPLVSGQQVNATVTAGGVTSQNSNTVTVQGAIPPAPMVDSPIYAGATYVTGSSNQAVGTTVTVYVNGLVVGTTTVLPGGIWYLAGIGPLADGNTVSATQTVAGVPSPMSPLVVVSSVPADVTPTPTVNSPVYAGATSISGTSSAPVGTLIDVYVNGVPVGQTTVQAGGVWTLTGVGPLNDGDAIVATATDSANNHGTSAPSATVYVSANPGNVTPAPTVSGPIYSGSTTVSGTSPSPAGTIIDVYANGVLVGETVVNADGTWTLNGVPPLPAGTVVTATATDLAAGLGTSAPSAGVIVVPPPPVVTGPLLAGGTSVSGTSTAPVGSTINVYVNGVPVGTAVVGPGGVWTATGLPPLVDGAEVTATVTVGITTSSPSDPVYVSANGGDVTATPTVTGPITEGETSVTGTSTEPPGTLIEVYVDGVPVGSTTVLPDGTWILTGVGPLSAGDSVTATATDIAGGNGTSATSTPVIVGPVPPIVDSSISAGATMIFGTSTAPTGTPVTVSVNGGVVGTAYVQADGTWWLPGVGPLAAGNQVNAIVTVAGNPSALSNTVIVAGGSITDTPTVSGPIISGATVITGTSTEPAGTTITVYVNGQPVGTAVVQPGGGWVLVGVGPLETGDVVQATATHTGEGTSPLSPPVTVQPQPPQVTGPIANGATSVTGSSTEPPGSLITVYVGGVPIGTTTVQPNGTWTLPGVGPLTTGQTVTATVTVGTLTSTPSGVQVVGGTATPPPVVTGPIAGLSTSVSGTGLAGATVSVYADGVFLGTALVNGSGNWTLSPLTPLQPGQVIAATQVLAPNATSILSLPVIVGLVPHLLRNDQMAADETPGLPAIFTRSALAYGAPALDGWGADGVPEIGEGLLTQSRGSEDDDDFYMSKFVSGTPDPDPTVLLDITRPVVYYELMGNNGNTLRVSKTGSQVIVTY